MPLLILHVLCGLITLLSIPPWVWSQFNKQYTWWEAIMCRTIIVFSWPKFWMRYRKYVKQSREESNE